MLKTLWQQWLAKLIRPRHPESGPIILNRRRVYIVPTRAGILYGIVVMSMLTGALNYDLALGYALVFLLVGLGFVGTFHTQRNLLNLQLKIQPAEPVNAGEIAHFPIVVENTAQYARVSLEWTIPALSEPPIFQHVAPESNGKTLLPIPTTVRGKMTLPSLRVASRYPLGLFLAWGKVWPMVDCLVYPRPVFTTLPSTQGGGDRGSLQGKEGQEDFAGFRERQPADSLKHVAWKAAARDMGHKPLLIKLFSGGAREELWLQWEYTQGDPEYRISVLAGWVMDAEAAGLDYGLSIPGKTIDLSHGHIHRHHCLEALALMGGGVDE